MKEEKNRKRRGGEEIEARSKEMEKIKKGEGGQRK